MTKWAVDNIAKIFVKSAQKAVNVQVFTMNTDSFESVIHLQSIQGEKITRVWSDATEWEIQDILQRFISMREPYQTSTAAGMWWN